MSDRFVHSLTIERIEYDDDVEARDDDGQPVASTATSTVRGLVQPRTAREIEDSRSAGSEVADHVIFLPAGTDVRHADRIVYGTRRFNLTGVRPYEYGNLTHIAVDARLVTATPTTEGAGS